ncbi:MAG: flagellar biosynthesis protein FlhF [Immundisolibacteraceae bacterium]|nr:flagellar biosynthesis protein FlhF [Immundisolibacteraceae bacterium]
MKIKRFLADNISTAMAQVRRELGPDAVILSNQQRDGQVEIVCGVDYDESRLASTRTDGRDQLGNTGTSINSRVAPMSQARAVGTALPTVSSGGNSPDAAAARGDLGSDIEQVNQHQVWNSDPRLEEMHNSVDSLRDLVENQLLDMVWAGAARHQANTSLAVRKLLEAGFSAQSSRSLLAEIPEGYDRQRALQVALTLLKRKLPSPKPSVLETGGRIAVVGPSGVGKTSIAVGLCAQFSRLHGVSEVALVGLDNQRVGAQEQLRMYGQLMGMPVRLVASFGDLKKTLDELQDKSMVVVDTAGFSGRDEALQPELRQLMGLAAEELQTMLVLPAYGSAQFLKDTVKRYRISIPQLCAISHLDAIRQPGIVLSTLLEQQLMAELVTDGPRIGEDLNPFEVGRLLARFQPLDDETNNPLRNKEAIHAG